MSVSTPILTLICWALAVPQASAAASATSPKVFLISAFLLVVLDSFSLAAHQRAVAFLERPEGLVRRNGSAGLIRDSPDDSRIGADVRGFPVFRQDRSEFRTLNAAFDPGGRRRRPRTSTAAAASVAPSARAPSSAPNRNIAKTKSPPAATSPSCGQQPLHQPGGPSRSRCAAPESRPPPPRDKERQLASPNAVRGEMNRLFTRSLQKGSDFSPANQTYVAQVVAARTVNAAFDPGGRRRRPRTSTAAAASVAPSARAPASAPNRNIAKTKSPPAATSPSCGP